VPDRFGAQDSALTRLALELTSGKPVSAGCFAAAEQVLSPRDITDALPIAAFYAVVALVIGAMGVELETPDQLDVEQAWQRQRSGRAESGSTR
jgi:sugar/nucleoside kinase (ribokinase family)